MGSGTEALDYPRRGEGWLRTVGTGGLLLSALLVSLVLVVGYFLQVVRATVDGDDPPDFDG